jgi:hypothetical protein
LTGQDPAPAHGGPLLVGGPRFALYSWWSKLPINQQLAVSRLLSSDTLTEFNRRRQGLDVADTDMNNFYSDAADSMIG